MLVIADLTVSKADLDIIEDCELRQVYGGSFFGSILGNGIVSTAVMSNAPGGSGGSGSFFGGILTNPGFSQIALAKAAGLKR
jgi:hypothetical protein